MFKRTRHPAWIFLCLATLVLFSALGALAQVAPVDRTGDANAAAPQQSATTDSAQQALPIVPVQRLHIFRCAIPMPPQ